MVTLKVMPGSTDISRNLDIMHEKHYAIKTLYDLTNIVNRIPGFAHVETLSGSISEVDSGRYPFCPEKYLSALLKQPNSLIYHYFTTFFLP